MPKEPLDRQRARIRRRLLSLAGAPLASLVLMEAAARIWLEVPSVQNGQFTPRLARAVDDPDLRYVLEPGKSDRVVYPAVDSTGAEGGEGGAAERVVDYAVNSAGFRDRERARPKEPGVFRIAVLGDSIVFGQGVQQEETFCHVLEERFRERMPQRRIEVLNCGVYGYNLRQKVALLEKRVLSFEPDLALIVFFANDSLPIDFHPSQRPSEARWIDRLGLTAVDPRHGGTARQRLQWRVRELSHLADYLCARMYGSLQARALERVLHEGFRDGSPGWREIDAALRRAASLAREKGFALHLSIHPYLRERGEPYGWDEEEAKVRRLSAELGIPFHDLADCMPSYDLNDLVVHPLDPHPSEVCHNLIGERLVILLRPGLEALAKASPPSGSVAPASFSAAE